MSHDIVNEFIRLGDSATRIITEIHDNRLEPGMPQLSQRNELVVDHQFHVSAPEIHHRQIQAVLPSAFNRDLVAGIGVTHDATCRIVPENAPDALVGLLGAVTHDDKACMLRIAHANTATMMQ